MESALQELTGASALAVAAVGQIWHAKKCLPGAELLDLLPRAIHSFAVGRLATPKHAELGEARAALLRNIALIRHPAKHPWQLTDDMTATSDELEKAKGQGDVDTQDELLRELERAARMKRGLN